MRLLIFVPILRRLLGLIIRLAIFFIAVGIAAAGVTMILNNETIFEKPGFGQRVEQFLTMNSAAASTDGLERGDLRRWRVRRRRRLAAAAPPSTPQKNRAPPEIQTTRNDLSDGRSRRRSTTSFPN